MFYDAKQYAALRRPTSRLRCFVGFPSLRSGHPTSRLRCFVGFPSLRSGHPTSRLRLLLALTHLRLTIVLDADALDEVELGFEEVDVLLLGLEDRLEQLARHEVPVRLAIDDGSLELDMSGQLELQVAL